MRLCHMVMLAALAVIASGCSPDSPAPRIATVMVKPALPDVAVQKCSEPSGLPDRDLTAREVATKWGADRSALIVCEQRRSAAVAAVTGIEPTNTTHGDRP